MRPMLARLRLREQRNRRGYFRCVDWYIVGALLLGSLPGISIGSYPATRISDRFLLPALGSMLVLIGLRLVVS